LGVELPNEFLHEPNPRNRNSERPNLLHEEEEEEEEFPRSRSTSRACTIRRGGAGILLHRLGKGKRFWPQD
jgi:hypothetical protein